jgi:hypothetical protein
MLRERIIWIVALLMVGGLAFYGGRTMGIQAGQQSRAQAAQQFFGQRGGGQGGGQGGFRGGNGAGGMSGMAGTVTNVSGNTITITTRDGQTATVQLAPNATIRKQVDGQTSDITNGQQIVAFGTQNGDSFQAMTVQIGGQFGFGPQNGGGRNNQPQSQTPTQ